MASLTSDVTGDNREESSETKPSQRTAPPPKVETTAFEGQKRLKLSRKPRETSHGQTFKYRVEEREEKERIKARRPIDRRKKEEKESKMLKVKLQDFLFSRVQNRKLKRNSKLKKQKRAFQQIPFRSRRPKNRRQLLRQILLNHLKRVKRKTKADLLIKKFRWKK